MVLHGPFEIDENVPVAILLPSGFNRDFLVPAVHAADRVWLNGEGEVLIDSCFIPPDATRIGVITGIGGDALFLSEEKGVVFSLDVHQGHGEALTAPVFVKVPPTGMVAAGDDPRSDALCDPHA